MLKDYLDKRNKDSEFLFLGPRKKIQIHASYVRNMFERYGKQVGLKITPYTLRHTFAAHLAQNGMEDKDIQALLGHEDLESTLLYSRLFAHARKKMYDQFF